MQKLDSLRPHKSCHDKCRCHECGRVGTCRRRIEIKRGRHIGRHRRNHGHRRKGGYGRNGKRRRRRRRRGHGRRRGRRGKGTRKWCWIALGKRTKHPKCRSLGLRLIVLRSTHHHTLIAIIDDKGKEPTIDKVVRIHNDKRIAIDIGGTLTD